MTQEGTPWVRSAEHRTVYANALRVRPTPYDLGLVFGTQTDITDSPNAVQEEVTVILSLAYAKIVASHLAIAIAAAESVMGPIKLPADAIASDATKEAFTAVFKAARLK
jgi:hypothetical protein